MKKKTIKALAILLSIGLASYGLVGCAKTEPSLAGAPNGEISQGDVEKPEKSEKPITLTAMISQSRNYDGLQHMIQKLKDEENIIIDAQVVPDDQYTTLMKMKVNSGESPDMIDYNIPGVYYELNPEEFFADLSDEAWINNLISPKNIEYNGKTYGYPFQSVQGVFGFIYNKDIFEAMSIEEPQNWDELLKAAEKIKNEGDGIVPIHIPKDTWVPQIYMTANYATALGERTQEVGEKLEKNELKWTEVDELAQVLDQYLGLFSAGYVNDDFTSVDYDGTIEAMGVGEAAMVFCGDFFANSVLEAFPEANLGMFNVPMVGNTDQLPATTQSIGFVASKDSKKLDTVKRVFDLWSTPEYGNLYFESRPGFPALKTIDGGETPSYLESIEEKYIRDGKIMEEFNTALTVGNNVVNSHLWLYYIDAPAKGTDTGQDILEKFQVDFEKYMKEMNQPGF